MGAEGAPAAAAFRGVRGLSSRLDRLSEGRFAAVVAAPGLLLVVLFVLPPILAAQMKSARDRLLDARAKGRDLTRPIGLLKQASIHQKRQEYESALRYLRLFHDEIGRLPPE